MSREKNYLSRANEEEDSAPRNRAHAPLVGECAERGSALKKLAPVGCRSEACDTTGVCVLTPRNGETGKPTRVRSRRAARGRARSPLLSAEVHRAQLSLPCLRERAAQRAEIERLSDGAATAAGW